MRPRAPLFARFISRERAERPNIDIEHKRREKALQHVYTGTVATVIRYRLHSTSSYSNFAIEQIERLAVVAASFTPGEAGELRRLGAGTPAAELSDLSALPGRLRSRPRDVR